MQNCRQVGQEILYENMTKGLAADTMSQKGVRGLHAVLLFEERVQTSILILCRKLISPF
jgi:hypothetical protein